MIAASGQTIHVDPDRGDRDLHRRQLVRAADGRARRPTSNFEVPLVRQGAKTYPASTHLLSKLRGPVAFEGGVTGADRTLKNGIKLPGEVDGPLFAIGAQAPESQQIDVLNIFNDDSVEDGHGVMTSTTLRGFGMAKDLEFEVPRGGTTIDTFGEPTIFPGGISYGTISLVNGQVPDRWCQEHASRSST